MTNLSKREIGLLVVLILAICGGVYYNFVLTPYFNSSADIDLKITDARSKLNDLKLKKASITMVDKKIADINKTIGQGLEHVLGSIDNAAIIVMLGKTLPPEAKETNIGFSSSYQDLKSSYITTVDISFTCTQDGFNKILDNLKNAQYINRVVVSSLNVSDTNGWEGKISIEILAKTVTPTNTVFNYS